MANHRIVCTVKKVVQGPNPHTHIVAVGTGSSPGKATKRWKVQEVLDAMAGGDVFYTEGETSGKVARVEKCDCNICGKRYIRSHRDKVTDNNLNYLRTCNG
jgi:Protein of unknown function (DUF3892)